VVRLAFLALDFIFLASFSRTRRRAAYQYIKKNIFLGFLCIIFFIYRYIEYCRATCKPRLSEKAAEMLQNKYVEIRQVRTGHFHAINWLSRILFLSVPDVTRATDSNP